MKVLVGLACVAVVAFVGYFFWGEWQDSQRREIAAHNAFYAKCVEQSKTVPDERALMLMSDAEKRERTALSAQCLEFIETRVLGSR